jgi:hypothetical protein
MSSDDIGEGAQRSHYAGSESEGSSISESMQVVGVSSAQTWTLQRLAAAAAVEDVDQLFLSRCLRTRDERRPSGISDYSSRTLRRWELGDDVVQ